MSWEPFLERVFGCGGIMAYHGIASTPHIPAMHATPARFREHVEFLRDRYRILPLHELVARWQARAPTDRCVAITFDDAYAGVARHAAPVLAEYGMPFTIFITSRHAEIGATYWWDDVEKERIALGNAAWTRGPASVGLPPMPASDPHAMAAVRTHVLARFAGRWPGELAAGNDDEWRSLRFDELADLARDERIDFGVHTSTHPSLPALAHADQVTEMRDNLNQLRDRLPRVVPIVAYPYGLYDRTTVRAAAEAGMICGVTMEGRAPASHPNLWCVPRVGAGQAHDTKSVSRRLNRALRPVLVLRNRSVHPRVPRAS